MLLPSCLLTLVPPVSVRRGIGRDGEKKSHWGVFFCLSGGRAGVTMGAVVLRSISGKSRYNGGELKIALTERGV
jgi:hypothetical protein